MYLLTLSFLLKILLMITKEYSKTRPIFRIVSGRILKFISFMNNFKISHMIYTTFPCNTLVKSCIIISWKFVNPPVTQLRCYTVTVISERREIVQVCINPFRLYWVRTKWMLINVKCKNLVVYFSWNKE